MFESLRSNVFRLRWFCVCVALAALTSCNTPDAAPPEEEAASGSPEARLDLVMERLERALTEFRPSGEGGLQASSKLSYKLVPPVEADGVYKAKVTIHTMTVYQHEDLGTTLNGNNGDSKPSQPGLPDSPALGPHSQTEEEEYTLVFRDGAWALETEPEKDSVRLWFSYALRIEVPAEGTEDAPGAEDAPSEEPN